MGVHCRGGEKEGRKKNSEQEKAYYIPQDLMNLSSSEGLGRQTCAEGHLRND